MDIDTTRDEYRLYNEGGYFTICKLEYDVAGQVVSISGPVFPQAASPDGFRTQVAKMLTALESPIFNAETLSRVYPGVKSNLRADVPSRSDEDVAGDGTFTGSDAIPYVRNALEEELTTRAAQAAQHVAEKTAVEPALAVSFVPKTPDPEKIVAEGERVAEEVEKANA